MLRAFEADARAHFAALIVKEGVSTPEAAALALRLAAGAAPPPLDADALLEAVAKHRAALSAASSDQLANEARAALLSVASAAFDPDALSRSFLLVRPSGMRAVSAVLQHLSPALAVARLSIDVEAASRVFDALEAVREAAGEGASTALQAAANAALIRLAHAAKSPAGAPGATRVGLLLLLCCCSLREPAWHVPYKRLLDALASLPPPLARVASLAMQALPAERFTALLESLQGYVLARFYDHLDRPAALCRAVGSAMCVMSWMYAANEAAGGSLAPPEAFWNDCLNSADWTESPGHHAPSLLSVDYDLWADAHYRASAGAVGRPPAAAQASPAAVGGRFSFCAFPFIYSPATKARIIAVESGARQRAEFSASMFRSFLDAASCPFCILRVRRDRIVADATRELARRRGELHKPLKVVFLGEEGVDEGGPTREFFALVTRAILSPDYAMFRPVDDAGRLLWFAPGGCEAAGEEAFESIGTVLGLAIYNGTLLELPFPRLLYSLLQGGVPRFDDLRHVSPQLHSGLTALLAHPPADVEADFGLTFQANYTFLGEQRAADLVPGGADRAVTGENVREYVAAYADWFLSKSVSAEFAAFRRGWARLADGPAVRLFRPDELEQLLCGCEELDFAALEASAQYGDGMQSSDTLSRSFWRVAHALPPEQKKKLLAFVTGSDRVPVGGLAALPFKLIRNGDGDERLPTAQTCFNTLLLPDYSDDDALRSRLLLALDNAEGFGLR